MYLHRQKGQSPFPFFITIPLAGRSFASSARRNGRSFLKNKRPFEVARKPIRSLSVPGARAPCREIQVDYTSGRSVIRSSRTGELEIPGHPSFELLRRIDYSTTRFHSGPTSNHCAPATSNSLTFHAEHLASCAPFRQIHPRCRTNIAPPLPVCSSLYPEESILMNLLLCCRPSSYTGARRRL